MSVGVCVAVSDRYAHYLPGWASAVGALDPAPDQVLIVSESRPRADLLPAWEWRRLVVDAEPTFGGLWDQAIEPVGTDWVAWIGVDDRYRPGALTGLDETDADVVGFGFAYTTGQTWMPQPTRGNVLACNSNQVPCGSPLRRSLWEPGWGAPFGLFGDWATWVGMALAGAEFTATGRVDVDYYYDDHIAPPLGDTPERLRRWVEDSCSTRP